MRSSTKASCYLTDYLQLQNGKLLVRCGCMVSEWYIVDVWCMNGTLWIYGV